MNASDYIADLLRESNEIMNGPDGAYTDTEQYPAYSIVQAIDALRLSVMALTTVIQLQN